MSIVFTKNDQHMVSTYSKPIEVGSESTVETQNINIPEQLLGRYKTFAVQSATIRQLEDATWFAEIPGVTGVWAQAGNPKSALDEVGEVLEAWILLKRVAGDQDIPVLNGIDLNYIR